MLDKNGKIKHIGTVNCKREDKYFVENKTLV